MSYIDNLFSAKGKVIVFTGGAGILSSALAAGLGKAGATIILTDIIPLEESIRKLSDLGISAYGYSMDVLDRKNVETVSQMIAKKHGKIDVLLNAAGGNCKEATTSDDVSFFDLPLEPLQKVIFLNLFGGSIIPSQVIGKIMVKNPIGGNIINFSSMAAFRPLTRTIGYSAAKASISNFTEWLAVYIAQNYTPKVRVNALAPGFFATNQNQYLLYKEDGNLTPRGEAIIKHTPVGRFGDPDDLISTVLWLISPASQFITGVVVPIDGGFHAYSGV